MTIRKKHFFICPWNSAVDLYAISAVGLDHNGCMSTQLYGGGFQRGPADPLAPAVTVEVIEALLLLEGVEVTRSGLCKASVVPAHHVTTD